MRTNGKGFEPAYVQKIKTALWFAQRPDHWAHAWALALRKFEPGRDGPDQVQAATTWAAGRAVAVGDALRAVGMATDGAVPVLPPELTVEGRERAKRSKVQMGGPGDLDLLFAAVSLSGAKRVVETGVAYGWSSLAILAALQDRPDAHLVSVDMPYPKMSNEPFVGIVVPDRLRGSWEIVREPDRNGLKKAIGRLGGRIDLCHYNSDKSWSGRQFGFALLWQALEPGGLLISDDIQDNMAFAAFVERERIQFAVTSSQGKYIGLTRKPVSAKKAPV